MDIFCNNCGKSGHNYQYCKLPTISMGIIAFTKEDNGTYRFLMICRKNTLGFMDFMRGKYSIYNKEYIIGLLKEMTIYEKEQLLKNDFDNLWKTIWSTSQVSSQYRTEELKSRDKMSALLNGVSINNNSYTLEDLIKESNESIWEEAEWGFPKGRRNHNEKDIDCALREFVEETGYSSEALNNIENLQCFEEIFMGSNYKCYKHKYYLMEMASFKKNNKSHDKREVSKVEWKTYEECLQCIRPYNLEKKKMIEDVYHCLTNYKLSICNNYH